MKRILVATDLGEGSREAIRQARAYALSDGAAVGVCHVTKAAEQDGRVRALVARQLGTFPHAERVEIFVEHGSADVEVLRRAEAWSADLVIVGTGGASGGDHGHLGAVAEHILRSAHCPVLVARPTLTRGVVLAATDFSDPTLPAVSAGAAESRRRDASFVLLHAIDFGSLAVTIQETFLSATQPNGSWNIDQQMRDTVASKLRAALGYCDATGDVRVEDGKAALAIIDCADELGAELIVVGNRERAVLTRFAFGGVAERVIRRAHCSVLSTRLN